MKQISNHLLTLAISVLGFIIGHFLSQKVDLNILNAEAAKDDVLVVETLKAKNIEVVSNDNRKLITMGTSGENSAAMWFFDKNGKYRLNLGLYGDGNAMIVLADEKELAVQILRTFGPKNSPVLVMKNDGRDRIVMGLNPGTQDPFLVHYDSKGKKEKVFGDF